jgi:hypothetical protein
MASTASSRRWATTTGTPRARGLISITSSSPATSVTTRSPKAPSSSSCSTATARSPTWAS